jgi:hypothetical protein
MFAAAGVAAKKPGGDPPPGPSGDPCATMATFTPDFVFWRDTGNRKNPQVTIFLAESTTGCEKKLVDVSLKDSYNIQNLKFSSVEDEGGFFGRVVWTNVVIIVSRQDASVWKMDFRINGTNLAFLDDRPVEVLRNGSLDDPNVSETIFWSLDLSPDTGSLVYAHLVKENDLYNQYLRILPDIDECVSVNDTDPCSFYAGEVLDQTGVAPSSSKGPLFTFSSWGPKGNSIFVLRRIPDPGAPFGSYTVIQYYDLLSQVGEAHQLFSDPPFIARPVSGMVDNTQYLAVEKEFSEKTGGCEGIFITEFENCLASEEDCFTIPVIAGKFPSWTKDGKLIHAYDGWAPHGGCGLSAVGVYDPSEGSLKSILDGQEPDAASN